MLTKIIFVVAWIIIGAFIYSIYHKVFDITYFGLGSFGKELFIIAIISLLITEALGGAIGNLFK